MKLSFYPRLAWDAIRKNRRMYFPYILTGSVMVAIYYILSFLTESPTLEKMEGGAVLMFLLPLGGFVIAFFSLLFLFYTNSFLVKQRYREFGLYNILGMDKKNIGILMVWETVYTAAVSIVCGLVCGIALSKAAELVLLNLLGMDISFTLAVGTASLWQTALIYMGIYLVLLLNSVVKVHRSRPLELVQSSRVGEKKLRCNWVLAVAGVVLLCVAYYMAVSIEEPVTALMNFFVAVLMVILGTFLLFISGSVALCRLLQNNKKYYYRPEHFVSVASMAYRMKRNGAGLASICILLTMVLVMLSSTSTLYFGETDAVKNRYPNDINITVEFDSIDGIGEEQLGELRALISHYAPDGAELSGERYAMAAGQFTNDGIVLEHSHVDSVDYDRVGYLYIISIDDYNRMMGDSRTLSDGECFIYSARIDTRWESFTMEYGDTYIVKERLSAFRESGSALAMIVPNVYIVVEDVFAFIEPAVDLKNYDGYPLVEYQWLCGFDCEHAKDEISTKEALSTALYQLREENATIGTLTIESREEERAGFFELYGGLLFLGIMLSVAFLMAAVLIIYYKQISEGYEDQGRFEIMQKVGMTKQDIKKSINSQMLTVFFTPLIMAGMHLAFAFPFISKILIMFAFDDTVLNAMVTFACFAVFGALYAVVYKISSGSYYAIVSDKRERR